MKRVPCPLSDRPLWPLSRCSSPISPANAQTFSSSYTSTAPKDCRRSAAQRRRRQHHAGVPRQSRPGGADQRGRSARNRLGRPQPRPPPRSRPRSPGSARSIRPPTPSNGGRWTASPSRSSSAGTSPTMPTRTRTAGRSQTDAGGDAAAAGPGLPCRLCRRAGQPQRQRTRPHRPPTSSRVISNAARTK